jgi:hypothetical protein
MPIQWAGAFESWSRGWVQRNFWRVRHLMDEDDALQECAFIFARCLKYYAAKEGMSPAWMMSLYQRSVHNDWHTFSTKDTRYRDLGVSMTDGLELMRENMPDKPMHILSECWMAASGDLRAVLSCIAAAPADILDIMFCDDIPERLNRRLLRLAGIRGSSADVVTELRNLLTEGSPA